MANNGFGNDPFGGSGMDDIFNSLFNSMGNDANARYSVNGHVLTPEQVAEMRRTGQIPGQIGSHNGATPTQAKQQQKAESYLDKIGRNLTDEAKQGFLDPVIGRDKEIQETAEILSRRIKNNPILVGDAGVGKTAIVEGLAQKIVKGDVPATIKDKQVISIDLSSLEAGTQYRGAYEENIQKLVEEVKERKNVILFFDEIHQIVGAGASGDETGGKGLSDILKPALSRGEISVIGATTQDEYRNTIMKDAALARRFNDVVVNAPSKDTTFEILKGIRKSYEDHHQVKLPDDVLKAAIEYSEQYIPQRSLPDKAIDLIDMTAAHLAAKNPVTDKVSLEKELKAAKVQKAAHAKAEKFEEAAKDKAKIAEIEKKLKSETDDTETPVAKPSDIADSVERLTGIPVSQMSTDDMERLKSMDSRLKSHIIGQDEAVDAVVDAIRRNRAGFDDGNRPIGSFLFVGPTGVGKTELVKQLAKDMFNDEDSIIRLDMSEYQDETAVSKMIGATAGYVGYNDNGNTLTERVRRNPYSIVLLDEIEKANPQVITLLLQVMDDGRLTDGQGNVVNFKNTVIIATSNAGFSSDAITKNQKEDMNIMDRLAPYFRPEFLNRFNAIVEFSHLTKEDLSKIVDLMIDNLNDTLARKDMKLEISDEVKNWLMEQGYDEAMGARPLRRVIEQQLRDKIAMFYLDHQEIKNIKAVLDHKNDTIKIEANEKASK
ncbi:ATP-dependent Clp protease ATP-binding subunit [Lactobacillus sanfranciscensis]|uniref:Putative ATP-dependent Clp protease ATP-binding subunit n=1 Tax=Fructilactobacillus sanfranciscensis (strain TMW 1.1304) TaxID=714313 RepID=G2KUN8_FRUST|nr:ATP-dependent Clp protease ATP-binding subunit [Fructilactobacillus sanfranciscensis]AEN99636.1 putative ATP-dependent Clp protease ATP-binding subunit [Fructilactobacillus sanfranciscensis TMW 1.1304]NDR76436.1 ATP-dependent Clp protease ATP-binding subunit [Fructilactobacillus sanfranciscensis]NDR97016.1 ATP-dependent Clp protease ATP-binding subunit [Fructilactobacillus sanfranciscensis]NDS04922.1 ATP-dependent Clp protease ATP-binding subunit [Fructilactobacillus sanfranciscensis]POH187